MQSNIRIIELLRFLYQQTDEVHAVTVSEMIEYLKSKGFHLCVKLSILTWRRWTPQELISSKSKAHKTDISLAAAFLNILS